MSHRAVRNASVQDRVAVLQALLLHAAPGKYSIEAQAKMRTAGISPAMKHCTIDPAMGQIPHIHAFSTGKLFI